MKRCICLMFALLIFGCALAEEDARLEQMFLYRICLNPEIAQQPDFDKSDLIWEQPTENRAYQELVMSYAMSLNMTQEKNGLRFTALRGISVNNLCALEWSIENISGEPRQLGEGWMHADGETGAYSVHSLNGVVLRPGEMKTGMAMLMIPDLNGDTVELSIEYSEYAIGEMDIAAAQSAQSGASAVNDDEASPALCSEIFTIELPRSTAPELLRLEFPIETEWRDSTLRVENAQLSLSNGIFTILRIFDTREAALAEPSWEWDFELLEVPGEVTCEWIRVGGGTFDDEPFEMEDGRWAYRLTKTAEFINHLPDKLYIVPRTEGENGYMPEWDAAIELR
ncbi:MAG: hypothetical protein IJ466_11050 [Clostridia bacterium]|nr:hypothetical protein [Clostridia bacterium]